jgi:hypothetical protein
MGGSIKEVEDGYKKMVEGRKEGDERTGRMEKKAHWG